MHSASKCPGGRLEPSSQENAMQHDKEMSKQSPFPSAAPPVTLQVDDSVGGRGSEQRTGLVTFQDAAVQLGKRTIWRHATFQIESGEFVTILGPNGAGKSTLLRLLLGLLTP